VTDPYFYTLSLKAEKRKAEIQKMRKVYSNHVLRLES